MQSANFLISDKAAEEFFNSRRQSCLNTGTDKLPSFGNESSFLSPEARCNPGSNTVLAIDVGGTRSKVCVRTSSNGVFNWNEILDIDNNHLKTEGSAKGLFRMTAELGKQIAAGCHSRNIPLDFDGISIVWSNKLHSFPLQGTVRGVGAKVFGSKSGQAYRKGEWWNSDISDGDDISAAFLSGLEAASIKTQILVVANDTVFTALALSGAIAGVVASTGANSTMVPVNGSVLLNSECAAAIEIPAEFLNLKKTPACLPGTDKPIKLEDILAGRGLPQIFEILISEALAQGETQLQPALLALRSKPIGAKQLELIVGGNIQDGLGSALPVSLTASASIRISDIAKQLIQNAGKMCAVLILMSVANQLSSNSEILVALDSSQARFVPGYRESLDNFLSAWNDRNNKKVRYQLLAPEGQISVPLRGAANAIEQFL